MGTRMPIAQNAIRARRITHCSHAPPGVILRPQSIRNILPWQATCMITHTVIPAIRTDCQGRLCVYGTGEAEQSENERESRASLCVGHSTILSNSSRMWKGTENLSSASPSCDATEASTPESPPPSKPSTAHQGSRSPGRRLLSHMCHPRRVPIGPSLSET